MCRKAELQQDITVQSFWPMGSTLWRMFDVKRSRKGNNHNFLFFLSHWKLQGGQNTTFTERQNTYWLAPTDILISSPLMKNAFSPVQLNDWNTHKRIILFTSNKSLKHTYLSSKTVNVFAISCCCFWQVPHSSLGLVVWNYLIEKGHALWPGSHVCFHTSPHRDHMQA